MTFHGTRMLWVYLMVLTGSYADAASAETPRVFCGRILADARVLYCYGSDLTAKRNLQSVQYPAFGGIQPLGATEKRLLSYDNDATAWPWWPARQMPAQQMTAQKMAAQQMTAQKMAAQQMAAQKMTAQQMSAQQALASLRPKRSPGLVDECCLKACFVSELMNYC